MRFSQRERRKGKGSLSNRTHMPSQIERIIRPQTPSWVSHVCVWVSLGEFIQDPARHIFLFLPQDSLATEVYCWWHANTPLNLPIAVGARTKHLNSHSPRTEISLCTRIPIRGYIHTYIYIWNIYMDGGCWLSAWPNGRTRGALACRKDCRARLRNRIFKQVLSWRRFLSGLGFGYHVLKEFWGYCVYRRRERIRRQFWSIKTIGYYQYKPYFTPRYLNRVPILTTFI